MNKMPNPIFLQKARQWMNPEIPAERTLKEEDAKAEYDDGINAPELKGFIYVPSIRLYVAKEKTLYGKNWYECHEELHKKDLYMITLPQFIEFIKYLKKG